MKTSLRTFIFILCALISAFLLTAYAYTAPKPKSITTCTLNLQVFIRQGHNANNYIAGKVVLDNIGADFKGNLVTEKGLTLPVSIHFDGPAVYFILDTVAAQQGRIFGTGMMDSAPDACAGNGGGTVSGPAADDLGNWRGQWLSETRTIPDENPPDENVPQRETRDDSFSWFRAIFLGIPIIAVAAFVVFMLRLMRPFDTSKWKKRTGINTSLQKINKNERTTAGVEKPVAKYLATYNAEDTRFDITFAIDDEPQYLGECGVLIAKTLDAKLTKVTALEIWVFDAKSTQTTTRRLMSHFCNQQEILRSEMQQKGESVLIQPGETVTIQTQALKINAKILEIEYMADTSYPQSIFKKVVMQIDIWRI